MTYVINVLHITRKWEALALVKCKRADDPGLCWASWLYTTSVSERQWRVLCPSAVGAWGWDKIKATASQGFLQSQMSRNACQQGLTSYVPFPSPSVLHKGVRDKNVLWLSPDLQSHYSTAKICCWSHEDADVHVDYTKAEASITLLHYEPSSVTFLGVTSYFHQKCIQLNFTRAV